MLGPKCTVQRPRLSGMLRQRRAGALNAHPLRFVSFASVFRIMLHCNMHISPVPIQLGLEDLLGELQYARRNGDLGRLALLAYCEVRRWARAAGEDTLAEHATVLVTHSPPVSREAFLNEVDVLITRLEEAHNRFTNPCAALRD